MAKKYDQQDGAPNARSDSNETISDSDNAHPAAIGERSTQENMAGQGLGQNKGEKDEQRVTPSQHPGNHK